MVKRICLLASIVCLLTGSAAFADDAAPAPPPLPTLSTTKQVNVSVKVIEFQTTKGVETGLSAYFRNRTLARGHGLVSTGGHIQGADLTFPTDSTAGITVFLDRMHVGEVDFELILQALVDQNRACILSQPKAMVTVGSQIPTVIQTSQRIPYENTVVVGATAVQTTAFRDTGVNLTIQAPEVIDDDGDWMTNDDTYVQLVVNVGVNEEGQRIVVALTDQVAAGGGVFNQPTNAITVPEFISRSAITKVWVRHGQVLILGGLYRNTKNKSLSTLPWLSQGEDLVMGLADRVLPGRDVLGSPISASVGNRKTSEGRRELVFLIKAELWKPAFTVSEDFGLEVAENESVTLPGVIQGISEIPQGIMEGISEIPQGIVEGIAGEGRERDDIDAELGGGE